MRKSQIFFGKFNCEKKDVERVVRISYVAIFNRELLFCMTQNILKLAEVINASFFFRRINITMIYYSDLYILQKFNYKI